jgi:hypothetical protein
MKPILVLAVLLTLFTNSPAPVMAQSEVLSVMGTDPITARVPTSDTSQVLTTAFDTAYTGTDPTWTKVKSVLITCETYDIRIAFGVAASKTASSEVGHVLAVGQSLRIPSGDLVRKARIINKTTGSNGVLQVTVEK